MTLYECKFKFGKFISFDFRNRKIIVITILINIDRFGSIYFYKQYEIFIILMFQISLSSHYDLL